MASKKRSKNTGSQTPRFDAACAPAAGEDTSGGSSSVRVVPHQATLPGSLDLDITQLTAAYRTGLYRPSAVIGACIDLISAAQGRLNFLVENRFEAARAEAALSDERYRSGRPMGALDGVPMTVKESFEVEGMKTTGGLPQRRDFMSETDADAVARMRAAGAIVLGKTNTPPLCLSMETDNLLYGRTNNPWNPLCTPGGSSGGEAVAVAIGAAVFGIGSDMGGSVRLPAAFCGVVGYKPAPGAFPWGGHFPAPDFSMPELVRMIAFGPLARSVRDARLLANILHPLNVSIPVCGRIGRLQVAGAFSGLHLHPDIEKVLAKAAAAVGEIASETRFSLPGALPGAARIWQHILSIDGGSTMARLAYGEKFAPALRRLPQAAADLFRRAAGRPTQQHPWIAWAILGSFLFAPSRERWRDTLRELEAGFASLHEELDGGGVLLSPAWPAPAPPHGQVVGALLSPALTYRTMLPYAVLPNVYGLPSITVPCGFSSTACR
jgi:Asp-tRNA(Asn)/Glu-tRNA(Gln) amidotransferase A subunit family amidase